MSADEIEAIIRENISSLLSHRQVKSKTETIIGEWRLLNDEISFFRSTPKSINFIVFLENGSHCLKVTAKLNRDTSKLSNIVTEAG